MTPVNRETVARKLGYLQKALDRLAAYRSCTVENLHELTDQRLAAERLLQTSIESAIDCARLLVLTEDWRGLRDERDAPELPPVYPNGSTEWDMY